MNREKIRAKLEEIGIIPAVRVASAEEARIAVEGVSQGGIPVVEITMTIPGALDVIADLVRHVPHVVVGAGTVLDVETARQCLDAGAQFITSPGLDVSVVEHVLRSNSVVIPGALTPTEICAASKTGADFVKVFPCSQVGGESYIRALKRPFPKVPLVAAGGVNQRTAAEFILAGASAIGVGADLISRDAIQLHQQERIRELARRFVKAVQNARAEVLAFKGTSD